MDPIDLSEFFVELLFEARYPANVHATCSELHV